MATTQQYSLRWNNYFRHLTYALDNHRNNAEFVDVSLFCDGRKIRAHKVVLSSCSSYFKEIFKENPHPHPVIVFKFIKFEDLNSIIEFMYQGEVNVQQEALQSFLQTAELLAVQGLTAEEKEKSKPVQPAIIDEQKLIKTIPSTIRAVSETNVAPTIQTIDAGSGHLTLNLGQSISGPTATQTATQTIESAATHLSMHVQHQQHHQQQQQQQQHQHQHQHQQHHHVQTQLQHMVTLPATTNTVKKRKIYATTDDDNIYTTETVDYGVKEDATIVKTAEMTFLRSAVKMDIPEYIVSAVDDSQQLSDGNDQQAGQDDGNNAASQNVTQYTSEYEILTESEIEEKYQQAEADNTEITIEMGRLLNTNAGTTTVTTAAQASAMDETVSSVTSGNNGGNTLKTDNKSSGTTEETFICKVCKRKLQSTNALRRHIASRHSEISGKEHQCSTCKKSFKTKWSLSTHNSRFHRDVRVVNECIKMNLTQE